jgi:hypothetical protein
MTIMRLTSGTRHVSIKVTKGHENPSSLATFCHIDLRPFASSGKTRIALGTSVDMSPTEPLQTRARR